MPEKKNGGKKREMQESLQSKIKKLEEKIKQLEQELKEKNDKLLRSYADLQNYQKRMEKEISIKEEETRKKYLLEIIDLHELLKKAYEDNDPKHGLKLILNNLDSFCEHEQVKSLDSVGKIFDHNIHHAISTVEKDDCVDGEIIEEIKKGYYCGDKLLRPSQVVVAKKKSTKKEVE
ncbi:MAG: nucleotide exchange factor GrpE [Candidatus Thermoplasmatota archaeon]|jgi:molecular chaperone GrpE|nr:nucleotide exchange factor GrpE [Candidatus Thermoplasmatota archaeon]